MVQEVFQNCIIKAQKKSAFILKKKKKKKPRRFFLTREINRVTASSSDWDESTSVILLKSRILQQFHV